jgi:alkyl sulfatase BDS1-like metallo-beta-lactamase superfamily hydrolase
MAIGGRGLVAPNDSITRPGERRPFDGVEFVFQLAPDIEAPAEMHFWLLGSWF